MNKTQFHKPPRIAEKILNLLLPDKQAQTPLGDFEEFYNYTYTKEGWFSARLWYWGQVLNLMKKIFINTIASGVAMFGNYLKIAYRNLLKHKKFSVINISGLAIGMTICMLIMLYIQFELSYDKFHDGAENIYRIAWMSDNPQTRTPHPMAQAMVNDFPEVENAVSISPVWGPGLTRPTFSVRYGENIFDEQGFFTADTSFFNVFSFKLKEGNPETALQTIGGMIITEDIAYKYFGTESPLGKRMMINEDPNFNMLVTGVIENIPANSHFTFEFLISYATLKPMDDGAYYTWDDFGHFNYIKLRESADAEQLQAKLPHWSKKYIEWRDETFQALLVGQIGFDLQPMVDIHLHSKLKWELANNSDIKFIYLFTSAAVMILIIACINFMNLSTARSLNRSKEIGIRKAIGASRKQLFKQFMGEAVVLTMLSLSISILLVYLLLPTFNSIVSTDLEFNLTGSSFLIIQVFAIAAVSIIISGFYPAVFLSGFDTIKVLKDDFKTGGKNKIFTKALIVFQFAVSVILIIGAQTVSSQIGFVINKDLGFEKDQVVVVPIKEYNMRENYFNVKSELLKYESVLNASAVSNVPGTQFNRNSISWSGADERYGVSELRADEEFVNTLDIKISEGRNFSREFSTDLEFAYLLNETAARLFKWDTAVDKEIIWHDDSGDRTGRVVGVVKDFHFKSLHNNIEPLIIQILPRAFNYMLIKVKAAGIEESLEQIKTTWERFDPNHSFDYSFLNEDFEALYKSELQMKSLFNYFTILAIFVACMGLYGLSLLSAQEKRKETGIRKVLGASIISILKLRIKDTLKLVLISNLIAWPLAYFVMNNWLQSFAYKVELSLLIFALSGLFVLLVALATILEQALKAAFDNPINSIKYE